MMAGMKRLEMNSACPCGRLHHKKPLVYGACCGRWLEADTPVPDAESLMRSRYSAFALEHVEGQKPGGAHQLAPVATKSSAVTIFPEQKGGFAQDAEITFPALRFGGENASADLSGVMLARGNLGLRGRWRSKMVISDGFR